MASPAGTSAYAARGIGTGVACSQHFRRSGELTLSSLGIGTYLGAADASTDEAVRSATLRTLSSGAVNVVDTAINYRGQRAERSVGRALAEGIRSGSFSREGIFLSSKIGYLAPDSGSGVPPRQWVVEELFGTGALRPGELVGGSHAMSVGYLRDQLARTLKNLGVETVDLLYLHNAAESELVELGPKAFEGRLAEAFAFLEEARRKGRIAAYGLATWDSLRLGRQEEGYLSLERATEIAREVGGEGHGLRFVQFPLNPNMPEALLLKNQRVGGKAHTLLEAAAALGVGTFSSAPLLQGEAIGQLPSAGALTPAQTLLQFARSAPHHLAALVGQKDPRHVQENLALALRPPEDPEVVRGWV